jgi:uncharacterized membrane protein
VAGPTAFAASITNSGLVAGLSTVSDGSLHAVQWQAGEPEYLGVLGGLGANSAVLWPVKNNRGVAVGISQTDTVDENEERSCR